MEVETSAEGRIASLKNEFQNLQTEYDSINQKPNEFWTEEEASRITWLAKRKEEIQKELFHLQNQ